MKLEVEMVHPIWPLHVQRTYWKYLWNLENELKTNYADYSEFSFFALHKKNCLGITAQKLKTFITKLGYLVQQQQYHLLSLLVYLLNHQRLFLIQMLFTHGASISSVLYQLCITAKLIMKGLKDTWINVLKMLLRCQESRRTIALQCCHRKRYLWKYIPKPLMVLKCVTVKNK